MISGHFTSSFAKALVNLSKSMIAWRSRFCMTSTILGRRNVFKLLDYIFFLYESGVKSSFH